MKKLSLLSAFLLVFCLLVGCDNSNTEKDIEKVVNPEIVDEETSDVTITDSIELSSNSILELYQNEWKITCMIKGQDETLWNFESVMYIDWENAYQELESLEGENTMKLYGLVLEGSNYSRWDLYWEWKGLVVVVDQSMNERLSGYDVDVQNGVINITCEPWIEWISFEVPDNIEFSDLSNLY